MTTYAQLKQRVMDFSHRADLEAQVPTFVILAEGMIRRDLRASTYSVTLDEDDRVADGVYTLPSTLLEVRSIHYDGRSLENKNVNSIQALPASSTVLQYAVLGSTVEFRGVPGTDAELELEYFGHPAALSADEDVLALDDSLYLYGSLFALYQFTQDLELANAALETFQDTLRKLNEQAGRRFGGASQRSLYHFGRVHQGY